MTAAKTPSDAADSSMRLRITRRRCLALLGVGAAGLAMSSLGCAAPLPRRPIVTSSLQFRFEPLVDLYCCLRAQADHGPALPAAWHPALERMRDAAELIPRRRGLAVMNGIIAEHRSVSALSQTAEHMPETTAGGTPARAVLSAIADALRIAEPLYTKEIGPAHRKVVEQALRERVDAVLLPKEQECFSFLLSGLDIPDRGFDVPFFLVAAAPEPGSVTSRSRRLTAVCFVSVLPYAGNTLLEVILHEATHALQAAAGPSANSVLDRLRRDLQAQGIAPSNPLLRQVPHTLMFVHSGEAVRRLLDPTYTHYGDTHGYYAKAPAAAVVRTHWIDHLDGHISLDAAITRIVSGVVATVR